MTAGLRVRVGTIGIAIALGAAMFAATGIVSSGKAETAPSRPAAFAQCAGCHSTQPGKNLFGPSLAGVGGRRAGTLPGYSYSAQLKSSGLVWNAATLDRWLAAPQRTVPGTRMPFRGIPDRAQRQQVVAYLLSLK